MFFQVGSNAPHSLSHGEGMILTFLFTSSLEEPNDPRRARKAEFRSCFSVPATADGFVFTVTQLLLQPITCHQSSGLSYK